jgi:uncharacterized membrane protein
MLYQRLALIAIMLASIQSLFGAAEADDDRAPFFGRLHPLVIHFPIACLILAALAELLVTRNERWKPTVNLLVCIGLLGAAGAVATGLYFATDQQPSLLDRHRWLGYYTLGCATVTAVSLWLAEWKQSVWFRWIFRALLIASVFLVTLTASVGGDMVYGKGWLW